MTSIRFRSPVTLPLLRKGTPKPLPPDPRAYETFRVTQQFSDVDFYHKDGRLHNATDIGNFACGSPIVAMAPGVAYRVKDSAGALGIRIDHGDGISSEYWHLNRQDAGHGQAVNAGFQIGIVGRTGLGDVCHCHIEVKINGRKVDPEPLMFGGSLTVEDDMKLPADAAYFVTGTVGPGNRLRTDHTTTDGSEVVQEELAVQLIGIVTGGTAYTLPDGRKGNRWYVIRRGDTGDVRQIAHLLVTSIQPTPTLFSQVPLPAADCSPQEQTISQLLGKIDRARTANRGATQAQQAVEGALA